MKKVLIGMSGGVDSSGAAKLLKEQGYSVTGATMLLWNDTEKAAMDANRVCEHIGIDFITIDFREQFKKSVVDYFINEYISGRTPNPCIMCNKHLKFGAMLEYAKNNGYDMIATGHYGKIVNNNGVYELHSSKAESKDQSYFLYNFNQHILKHTIMPLSEYTKEQVREMANEWQIPVANKPDSQEICFVNDNDYAGFICNNSDYKPVCGKMLDVNGNEIGTHKGMIYYTIGQRKGIGAFGRPMFVMEMNPQQNTITLGEKGMEFSGALVADNVNYISDIPLTQPEKVQAKIRYQAKKAEAMLYPLAVDRVRLVFDEPQRAITPGQSVVFYNNDTVIGGGVVVNAENQP